MIFQILDANYTYDSQKRHLVQLFGTTEAGESVTCRVAGFRPYFYARVEEDRLKKAALELEAMGLVVEVVMVPVLLVVQPPAQQLNQVQELVDMDMLVAMVTQVK